MRHSLYVNNARVSPSRFNNRPDYSRQPPSNPTGSKGKKQKLFLSLDDQVRELLDLYEDYPETCAEIIGEINMYKVNVTIARKCNNSKAEKKLKTEFKNYIKTMKEKR